VRCELAVLPAIGVLSTMGCSYLLSKRCRYHRQEEPAPPLRMPDPGHRAIAYLFAC
jgi:hypothetical protein